MANELTQLFNEVLIVPLDEDFTDSLEEFYDDVVDDDDFNIDDCIVYFITGNGNPIKGVLQRLYENKYSEALAIPEICYLLYAQYVTYRYICHDEGPLLCSKINASIVVQSLMTIHRGRNGQIASMMFVDEMKDYVKRFISKSQLEFQGVEQLQILGQSVFTQEQKDDSELFKKVKALAVKAAKYDFWLLRSELNTISGDSPYLKAYEVAAKLAKVNHWEYVMAEPEATIARLLDGYTSNKMLLSIKHDLEQATGYNAYYPYKESSVILNYLYDGSYEDELGRQKFTPTQLAQHLFYEFLSDED